MIPIASASARGTSARTGRPAERGGTIANAPTPREGVRHSGPVDRTPDTAGGFGVLNELRHIGEGAFSKPSTIVSRCLSLPSRIQRTS